MQKPKILIVDDKPQNIFALAAVLRQLDVEVIDTTSPLEALDLPITHQLCLAIVDIQMPEMDGYELVELWRSNEDVAKLPVIFVSAIHHDEYHHRKGYEAGAVDFLSKPFNPDVLLSKVRVFLTLYEHQAKLKEVVNQLQDQNQLLHTTMDELEKSHEALSKLNINKNKFFSIIAHDLKGPFLPLLGNAELLAEMATKYDPHDIQEMSLSIHRSAKQVYGLLEGLLQWARLQMGQIVYEPKPFNLKLLVEDNVNLFTNSANNKEINLQNKLLTDIFILADRDMLDMVLRNLINNALKFTPNGGTITVAAHFVKQPETGQEMIEVSISDTGVGIKAEYLPKLFEINVHHTTLGTAQEKGTGLGLIMCREMIEQHHGKIWVESTFGAGTTVKFTIPHVS